MPVAKSHAFAAAEIQAPTPDGYPVSAIPFGRDLAGKVDDVHERVTGFESKRR
jgi:hypothetical protein